MHQRVLYILCVWFLLFYGGGVQAQEPGLLVGDSLQRLPDSLPMGDSLSYHFTSIDVDTVARQTLWEDSLRLMRMVQYQDSMAQKTAERLRPKKPRNPELAVWLSAVIPGAGQIYNRQYWKLPIIYGGAAGLAYAISWNNQMYVDYHKGYVDLMDSDPKSNYYEKLLPPGTTIDASNKDYYTRVIKDKQDTYQRWRDLSIIATAVLYLLNVIDAYVDSKLQDYDIGPDLSFKVGPSVLPASPDQQINASLGLKCKMSF